VQYQRPYVESSVFIAWIKGEVIDGVDRKQIFEYIVQLAQRGVFPIITSSFTLAEVYKLRSAAHLSDAEDEKILRYFEHEFIQLVDVVRDVGEHANRLCRQHPAQFERPALHPSDAIHLACAIKAKCDVLLTWDIGLTKIQHPKIAIEVPRILGQQELFKPAE
jgi:predicted nucleic acid-binding protein